MGPDNTGGPRAVTVPSRSSRSVWWLGPRHVSIRATRTLFFCHSMSWSYVWTIDISAWSRHITHSNNMCNSTTYLTLNSRG